MSELLLLAVLGAAYVAANGLAVFAIRVNHPKLAAYAGRELRTLRVGLTWVLVASQVLCIVATLWLVTEPLDTWGTVVLAVSSFISLSFLQLCVLWQIGSAERFASFFPSKMLGLALVAVLVYLARGWGAERVGDVMRDSAANYPMAVLAAAAIAGAQILSLVISFAAVAFEVVGILLLLASAESRVKTFNPTLNSKIRVLAIACIASMAACLIMPAFAWRFGSSAVTRLWLADVAMSFDAYPPDRCNLPIEALREPTLYRVVFLAGSFDKAMLYRQSTTEIRMPFRRWNLANFDEGKPKYIGMVACHV